MRINPLLVEDAMRAKAIICVARNVEDPEESLAVMEMLGLIDGKGEFVAADELMSHTNNPQRRGIGHWLS